MSMKVTYIGHSTTLLEIGGETFLTDPVFSKRILWFKRKTPLYFNPSQMPKLSAVLMSHPHHDHLDLFSFKYIPGNVPVIVPQGMETYIGRFLNNPIIELRPWAKYQIGEVEICSVPAKHGGTRWPYPISWKQGQGITLTHDEKTLYFAGDSAYGKHFKELGEFFTLEAALLPIAPCHPRWYYRGHHMDPGEALKAFDDLKAKNMIPIHHSTFNLGLEAPHKPIEWLKKLGEEKKIGTRLHCLQPGEGIQFPLKL